MTSYKLQVSLIHAAKDQAQFPCRAIKAPRFVRQPRFRCSDHAEEVPGFLCFLQTTADAVTEVALRERFIRLAIIRSDARAATDQLVNQPVVHRVQRNALREPDDRLAKERRSLKQIGRYIPGSWSILQNKRR